MELMQKTITINEERRVVLKTYILSNPSEPRPALIILPGGAFTMLSEREAEPVALTFANAGFHTFVLNYSIGDDSEFPNPLDDVSLSIWELKKNAEQWSIAEDAVFLMGFSAGACIAGMSATQWNTPGLAERLDVPEEGIKPAGAVIGYGASLLSTIFENSDDDLIVPEPGRISADRTPQLDLINYVDKSTVPMFIWHNRFDKYVPVLNALLLAGAMEKMKLPFELHIFQNGYHGMSVNNTLSHPDGDGVDEGVAMWVPLCIHWIQSVIAEHGKKLQCL